MGVLALVAVRNVVKPIFVPQAEVSVLLQERMVEVTAVTTVMQAAPVVKKATQERLEQALGT